MGYEFFDDKGLLNRPTVSQIIGLLANYDGGKALP